MRSFSLPWASPWAALLLGLFIFGAAAPAQATDLCGPWSGCWEDCKSGHHGPLNAAFVPCGDNHYRVTFTGRFFKVFPFRYSVVLNVTGREGDKIFLAGENNLPFFFSFPSTAEAPPPDFVAHFHSSRYDGQFALQRCCP